MHLDRVDQAEFGEFAERGFAEIAPHRIERMRHVDEPALPANRTCRLDVADPDSAPAR